MKEKELKFEDAVKRLEKIRGRRYAVKAVLKKTQ